MITRHREIEFDEQALHVFDEHVSELLRGEFSTDSDPTILF